MAESVDIAKLVVKMEVQSAKYLRDLDKQRKETAKWRSKTVQDVSAVRTNVNKMAKSFVMAAAAASGALAAIYTVNAQAIDNLAKQADKLGLTTEALQGLRYAGELTGVSMRTTDMAIQRMTRRVAEAAVGIGEARGALDELGISAKELGQLSPDKQFQMLAGAMANVSNQGDRVRLSMKLFDSEGVALVNTLALGEEGLKAAAAEVEALGGSISRFDAAKIEAANDEFTRAKMVSGAFAQRLTVELAPAVLALTNRFVESSKAAGGVGDQAKDSASAIVKGFGFAMDMGRGLHVVFDGIRLSFAAFVTGVISGFAFIVKGYTELANLIPGINIDYEETAFGKISKLYQEDLAKQAKALQDLAQKTMPSDEFDKWLAESKAKLAELKGEGGTDTGDGGGFGDVDDRMSSEQLATALERLTGQLATEEEAILESYLKREEIVSQALDRKLISETTALELRNRMQKKKDEFYLKQEKELADAKMQVAMSVMDFGIALAKEDSKLQRGLLAVKKAIAIREALINLQAAGAKALNTPWPANLAAIAQVAGIGAGMIGTLKGIDTSVPSFEGGGFTGTGARSGGMDGHGGFPAMLHPNEQITDLSKVGGNEVVNNYDFRGSELSESRVVEMIDDNNRRQEAQRARLSTRGRDF